MRILRCTLAAALSSLAAASAGAATQIPLIIDPGRSSIVLEDLFTGTPLSGPYALSGSLVIEFDQVPIPASTTFRMISLDAIAASFGPVTLASVPDPGSGLAGVSGGSGVLFFQTALSISAPIGGCCGFPPPLVAFTPAPGNTGIDLIVFDLFLQTSGTEQVHFVLTAVPEPDVAALLAAAGLSLAAWGGWRRRPARARARRSPPSGA
jgi:hypothetical protein